MANYIDLGPYNMQLPESAFVPSNAWWRNLSINQMKELEAKYWPYNDGQYMFSRRFIHQIWEAEGRPEPQKLIPVK